MNPRSVLAVCAAAILTMSSISQAATEFELVNRSEITLQPPNPLRGDASPKAGVLWGDIKLPAATGTLVQFRDGFASPPHIHNITYRAVVINGEVHNDDPEAARLWMEPGSFWTQPAGEVHITAAQGDQTTIFLEIMEGPYLVQPSSEAFDNGERPVNIAARHVVWLDPSDVSWLQVPDDASGPEISFLWGEPKDNERHGAFLKMPSGTTGTLESTGEWLRAVLIDGELGHRRTTDGAEVKLVPGSYFGAPNTISHDIACMGSGECLVYITAKGKFAFATK